MHIHSTAYDNKQAFKAFLFFCLFMLLGSIAHAQYATGGSSSYKNDVLWLTWGGGENGTEGQSLNVNSSSSATVQVADGTQLQVTCSITDHTGNPIQSYAPGGWDGDFLDDLYNIGGAESGGINYNELVNGIMVDTGTANFNVSCNATLNGQPYDLKGLVVADAEDMDNGESLEATAAGTWNIVEMAQTANIPYNATKTDAGGGEQTIRFESTGGSNNTGAVTFLSFPDNIGSTNNISMNFEITGAGKTAIAIGLLAPYADFGDALKSYDGAMHVVNSLVFTDDNVPEGGSTNLNSSTYSPGGLVAPSSNFLGTRGPDTEPGQTSSPDAAGDDVYRDGAANEEDAWPDNYEITVLQENESLSESVQCVGSGTVAGWIDFDQNETFDSDERTQASCTSGTADLTWSIPSNLIPGKTFVRLRYSTDPTAIQSPSGTAPDGEVEDHQIEIIAPQLSVTKSSNAASGTWSVDESNPEYTLKVTNNGSVGTGDPSSTPVEPVTVRDLLPTGIKPEWTGTHSSNGWSCTFTGQEVSCTTNDLIAASGKPNDQSTIQIPVQITEDAIGQVTNYASVAGGRDPFNGGDEPQPGPSCSNGAHCASDEVTVQPLADLSIQKDVDKSTPQIGKNVTFTLTAFNEGPSDATGVEVTDQLPDGYQFVSADPAGEYNESTGKWTIGDLASDGGERLDITVKVLDKQPGDYNNIATIDGNEDDPTGDNNTDSRTISASSVPAFASCSAQLYLSQGNGPSNPMDLTKIDQSTNPFTYNTQISTGEDAYNATAFNESDKYIYAIGVHGTREEHLLRIGSDGTVSDLGMVANYPSNLGKTNAGEIDPQGNYYVRNGATDNILVIDIPNQEVSRTISVGNIPGGYVDLAWHDGKLWTVSNSSSGLYSIDPQNGNTTRVGSTGLSGAKFGAMFGASNGVFGSDNNGQGFFRFNTKDGDAGLISDSPGSQTNDGAKCASSILSFKSDFNISKTDGQKKYTPGETVVYTITASNDGPFGAQGAVVNDDLPSQISGASWTCTATDGATCGTTNGSGTIDGVEIDLSKKASVEFKLTVPVPSDFTGDLKNTATITPTKGTDDPNPDNNEDSDTDTEEKSADLSITKTAGTGTPTVGEDVTFTLTATNGGPSEATGVEVTDELPDGYQFVKAEPTSEYDKSNGLWTIGTLANGADATLDITATVQADGNYKNTATISSNTPDPDPDNNTGGSTPSPNPSVDVALDKTLDTGGPFNVSQKIDYILTISNKGLSKATGIEVTDSPANLTINNVSGSGCSNLPCTIPSLDSGNQTTIAVSATISAVGSFNNTATATPAEEDQNEDNNTDDSGNGGNADPLADVALKKKLDTAGPFKVGQQVQYTIDIENKGPSEATAIEVTDTPTNLTIDNVSGSGCGSFPCTIPSLANSDQTTINVTATIKAAGAFGNTATATPSEDDPDDTNNTGQDGDSGNASADVAITKTLDTAGPYNAGEEVDYTVTITNNGPSDATGILVEEVPTNLTIDEVSGSGCSSFPCTIPNLDDGNQTTINVTGTIKAEGTFDNLVKATPTEDDPEPSNNEDNDGDGGGLSADVSIDKTLDTTGPFEAGQEVTYTLTVANAGPSEATNIEVTDSPTNLTITEVTGESCGSFPCTIPSLAAGDQQVVTVTATINAADNFDNTAIINSETPDPNPDNNKDDDPNNGGEADASADISIDKQLDTEGPYNVGQEVNYTITVGNEGPSPAQNVKIIENPTNLTFTDINGGGCSSFPCTLPSLANGDQQKINVTATIDEEGTFQNGVTVTSDTNDPNPKDNDDDDPENGGNAGTSADVSMNKTLDTDGPYVAGQELSYTMTVANDGPSEATGIEVTDNPTNLTITEVSGGCSSFPCTIASLSSGSSKKLTVTAQIDAAGDFDNTAAANAETPDPNPDDNEDDDPKNGGTADAPIVATNDNYGSFPGGANYPNIGVIFTNDKMDGNPIEPPKTNLKLIDELPEGMSVDSETGTFSVAPETPVGEYTFDYQICAADNPDNCDTATVTVVVEPPSADVSLDKTLDTDGPYVAGQQLTYTLTILNAGPSEATEILVEDSPENLTITEISGGGCSSFPCTIAGPLIAGDQQTVTVTARINAAGAFDNVATSTAAEDDPNPENNTDDKNNGGQAAAPELQITKQAQNMTARPGGFVPYIITIDNLSEVPVSGVQLVDTPAPGLSYVEQSLGVSDTDNAGLVEGLRPLKVGQIDVPAGGQATVSYIMRVGATALPGELRNVAVAARNGSAVSNEDEASVILEGDPIMDDTRILGTVFRDHDRDGWQDKATATGLIVKGGFAPDAYVSGSTTIDRGRGLETVSDGSAPLLQGLEIDDLAGRESIGGKPEQVVVRQLLRSPDLTNDFMLTSDEGTQLKMDSSGTISRNPKGALKRGNNSQQLKIDRSLEKMDNGQYELTYRISNVGYNDWGLPGTRLATPRGLIIETDGYGRYHIEAIEVDSWRRGRNYVVKVDDSSLPRNSRYTTENPLVRRVTQGLPVRFDFGVWWPSADVSITKTLEADSGYHPDQQVTYRLKITNDGPTSAENIRLSETPKNVSITKIDGAGCSELPCLIPGPLAVGEQRTVTVDARIDSNGPFTNTAAIWADQPDPVPGNNSAEVKAKAVLDTVAKPTPVPPSPCEGAKLLPKAVHFKTDKATLNTASEQMLDRLTLFMKDRQECQLRIAGHTDHDLGHAYNKALSERRSKAIATYLEAAGISADRIEYTGVSFDDPAVEESDILDKARNRRASFTLQPGGSAAAELRTQIEDLQVDPEPQAWDFIFDFRHNAVPTQLHFPQSSSDLNFVSKYLLKRIKLVLAKHPDVTVSYTVPVSGNDSLDKRREEALEQALAETGLESNRYHISTSRGNGKAVGLTYSPNKELILIDQTDDLRLADEKRYRLLLKKAWQMLKSRRDGPLMNERKTDRPETIPEAMLMPLKPEGIGHKIKDVLKLMGRDLPNYTGRQLSLQGAHNFSNRLLSARFTTGSAEDIEVRFH